jgi:four helix bundle protein
MELDHERLDVYHLALDFLVMANGIIEALPRGRSHLADQFTRASTSIVLNLSEGAGKLSKPDKRRYYLTARGSATESAALLDVCHRLELIDSVRHKAGKDMIVRIALDACEAGPSLRRVGAQIRSHSMAQPMATTAA